jgi:hypothetical protein
MSACDGACEEHRGEVRCVLVGSGGDWSEWNYCEAAVETDQRNGFRVFAEVAPSTTDTEVEG